jgi:hypothetical protein
MQCARLLPILLLASAAWGDEAADATAITRAIGALNERTWRSATVTSDPVALAEFHKLLEGKKVTYHIRPGMGRPTVTINHHRPWGEAEIQLPAPSIELQNPRVVAGAVRFISEDVALADGSLVERRAEERQSTPLLFVMKKDGEDWKIAALRVVVER